MDAERFCEYAKEALAHLYDRAYLQTHPLVHLLIRRRSGRVDGHALQQALLDAIEALKPSADVPYESLAWRKYRYLYLRYVQGMPIAELADDLGISLRQCRRYSQEALKAISDILWDQYQDSFKSKGGEEPSDPASGDLTESVRDLASTESPIDAEVVRLETLGRATMSPLAEVVASVMTTMRPLATRRGIDLRFTVSEELPAVTIERTILRQALISLLSLGIESFERTVTMSAEGMSQDAVEIKISGQFDRRSSCLVGVDRLEHDDRWSIARHLLQTQRGTCEAVATPEGRLLISVVLQSIGQQKVLVVEDNLDAIQLYQRYLSDSSFRVVAAVDPAEALSCTLAEKPAIILLDVMMPSRDGWEVLQTLKGNPETLQIPVIMCSVLKERDLALALGAADFLVKPVRRPELLMALNRLVAPSGGVRPN